MALNNAVPQLVFDDDEVTAALAAIGSLSTEIIHHAVSHGESAVSMLTQLHPAFQRGIDRYGGMVYGFREMTLPLGWSKLDERMTLSPDGNVAVMFATGDASTGVAGPDVRPRTKYPKGKQTFDAVVQNQQLSLLEEVARHSVPETWVILTSRSGNQTALELSRPSEIADALHGKVEIVNWSRRIIVPPYLGGGAVDPKHIIVPTQDFKVNVEKIG